MTHQKRTILLLPRFQKRRAATPHSGQCWSCSIMSVTCREQWTLQKRTTLRAEREGLVSQRGLACLSMVWNALFFVLFFYSIWRLGLQDKWHRQLIWPDHFFILFILYKSFLFPQNVLRERESCITEQFIKKNNNKKTISGTELLLVQEKQVDKGGGRGKEETVDEEEEKGEEGK